MGQPSVEWKRLNESVELAHHKLGRIEQELEGFVASIEVLGRAIVTLSEQIEILKKS